MGLKGAGPHSPSFHSAPLRRELRAYYSFDHKFALSHRGSRELQNLATTVSRFCKEANLKVVAYRRVSRQKQAQSGLGLEAQEFDITKFAAGGRLG